MQGIGLARRNRIIKVVNLIVTLVLFALLILLDQFSKSYFEELYNKQGQTTVIDGFFYLTHVVNKGAAWSFLGDKPWAQTFFKIITIVAICIFIVAYIYAYIKNYRWLQYGVSIAFAGTVGNFIDRLLINGVNDFLSFVFGTYHFPVFNVADICLCVGVAMIIIHMCFIDDNGIFVGKKKDEQN